jgi:hypothetical protein
MNKIKQRGGARPNAGAPRKDDIAKTRAIRLTESHWQKFKELGGVDWLRHYLQHIDK